MEMLVVIAIMSILMTVGAIGLGGVGGKGVTSGVATAESLFDEARSMAVGKNIRACVLIAKDLSSNSNDNLRRIVVAAEETEEDRNSPNFGKPTDPTTSTPKWVISNRGTLLPDQTYFSQVFSKTASGSIPDVSGGYIESGQGKAAKSSFAGSYYIYEFNSEGICKTPGASFVIGAGTRSASNPTAKPKITSSGKRDFGGFVVWRNGRTSVFRSPDQVSSSIKTISPGTEF